MAVQFAKSSSSNSWIFSLQVVLITIASLSLAFILHLSLPLISDFIVTQVPQLWTSMNSWFTRPYLYIVINGIILTIAASSRFHHHLVHHDGDDQVAQLLVPPSVKIHQQSTEGNSDFFVSSSSSAKVDDHFVMLDNPSVEIKQEFESIKSDYGDDFVNNPVASLPDFEKFDADVPEVYGQTEGVGDVSEQMKTTMISDVDEQNDFADSRSILTAMNRTDSMEIPSEYSSSDIEKPPVSARFSHRKTVKGSSNEAGKALRSVAKPKRNDTLESTWKTITEGRSIPLARHLKKSDTWETHNNAGPHVSSSSSTMKKSETFKDGKQKKSSSSSSSMNNPSLLRGSVRLRKEPSLSQDDLNRRVEAFINKFNEEMRLQRQASLNQYKEMVTRVGN